MEGVTTLWPAAETEAVIAKTCGCKRAYGARCARLVAERLRSKGDRVSPYRCFNCGSWHIGHPPSYEGLCRIADAIRDLHGNRPTALSASGRVTSYPSAMSRGQNG